MKYLSCGNIYTSVSSVFQCRLSLWEHFHTSLPPHTYRQPYTPAKFGSPEPQPCFHSDHPSWLTIVGSHTDPVWGVSHLWGVLLHPHIALLQWRHFPVHVTQWPLSLSTTFLPQPVLLFHIWGFERGACCLVVHTVFPMWFLMSSDLTIL